MEEEGGRDGAEEEEGEAEREAAMGKENEEEEGAVTEKEAMELLVLFRPERQQTGPDKRYGAGQLQVVWDTVNSFTVAHGLLATPLQGVQAHLGLWTNQHVARLAKEVDFMSNAKHFAQSAAMSGGLWFGAGHWKQTEITITSPDQGV